MNSKQVLKKLEDAGISAEVKISTEGDNIVIVDTNYNGPYPTTETWAKINKVKNILKRSKLKIEGRGYHTALYIYTK